MKNVIPLFVEDELTGLQIPNCSIPEQFFTVGPRGAERIFYTRNEAIQWISLQDKPDTFMIQHLPKTRLYIP